MNVDTGAAIGVAGGAAIGALVGVGGAAGGAAVGTAVPPPSQPPSQSQQAADGALPAAREVSGASELDADAQVEESPSQSDATSESDASSESEAELEEEDPEEEEEAETKEPPEAERALERWRKLQYEHEDSSEEEVSDVEDDDCAAGTAMDVDGVEPASADVVGAVEEPAKAEDAAQPLAAGAAGRAAQSSAPPPSPPSQPPQPQRRLFLDDSEDEEEDTPEPQPQPPTEPGATAVHGSPGVTSAASDASPPPAKRARVEAAGQHSLTAEFASEPLDEAAASSATSTLVVAADELDEGAFLRRFLAFRQYVEMLLQYLPSKTARNKPWRLTVRRNQLCQDVVGHFSPAIKAADTKLKLFQRTEVTFVDVHGSKEEGEDLGGLTVELYSCFFREVLLADFGLFEGAGDDASTSIGLLPSPTADLQSMNNIGRIMCRCVLDDQPLGRGLGRFVFEFLADAHEWRVFKDVHSALAVLSDFDPELSQRWAQLLVQPPAGLTLDLFDPDAAEEEVPPESAAMERAVLAGCRHKLLTIREASLRALCDGFTETIDLRLQLGALSAAELLRMLRGNTELSREQLLGCFAWPDASVSAEAKAGFAAAGSDAPRYLREIILDESPETGLGSLGRLHLLEWATALTALPCGGLKDPITLKFYESADEHDLPNVHTCTHEVHLPPYATREQLRAKLLLAVEHRHDGFQIE